MNELLSLPLAERLQLVQILWDSTMAEQSGPGLDADAALDAPSSSRSEHGAAVPASDRWLTLTQWTWPTDWERNR